MDKRKKDMRINKYYVRRDGTDDFSILKNGELYIRNLDGYKVTREIKRILDEYINQGLITYKRAYEVLFAIYKFNDLSHQLWLYGSSRSKKGKVGMNLRFVNAEDGLSRRMVKELQDRVDKERF